MANYDVRKVSRMTDISVDTVHHYVKKFRKFFPGLRRGKFNALIFSDQDVEFLVRIRTMNKMENLTLAEIKEIVKAEHQNSKDDEENQEDRGEKVVETQVSNGMERPLENFPIEKLENFENMLTGIQEEYKSLTKNNRLVLAETEQLKTKSEDLKNMMSLIYTKMNHIELRQQKIIDEVNRGFWTKLKAIFLKPIKVPFLWRL